MFKQLNKSQPLMELRYKFKHKSKNSEQYFYNCNKKVFDLVVKNWQQILDDNKVNLKKLLPDDLFTKLQQKNIQLIDEDGNIDKIIEKDIIQLLNQSVELTLNKNDKRNITEQYDNNFVDCDIVDSESIDLDNVMTLKPNKTLDKIGLMYNLFKDNNINFKFNPKINNTSKDNKFISTRKIRLNNYTITEIDMPTKLSITCKNMIFPKKDENFTPYTCNYITTFSPVDATHSSIYCKRKHILKNIDKATPEEVRKIYIYQGEYIEDEEQQENIFLSFNKITEEDIICNVIPDYDEKNLKYKYFILGWKELNEKVRLKNNILLKKPHPIFMLDIFESIKTYFKTYHNETVLNQNKYVGLIMIFQYIAQKYLHSLYPGMVLGKSRSGKTYFYSLLSKILLQNSVKIESNVTRNRFIGGQSAITINNNKMFFPGYVNTKNFIFINEMAEKIEEYLQMMKSKYSDISNNLFSMHKTCWDSGDNNKVDVGIQGSEEITVKAVPFSVGNFETLQTNRKTYWGMLKKQYSKLGGNVDELKIRESLFKPLGYYKENKNDELLIKAHQKVRENYNGYFLTGLLKPEQSRFVFFSVIDPKSKDYVKPNYNISRLGKTTQQTHKKELNEELDKTFNKLTIIKNEDIVKFENKISNWFGKKYIEGKYNQFKDLSTMSGLIGQLHDSLPKMNAELLLLHKVYYDLPLQFTDEDKQSLTWFNNFNYKMLSTDEAAMIIKPAEDCAEDSDEIEKDMNAVEREEKEKIEEGVELDINGKGEVDNLFSTFGKIPQDEDDELY